MIARDRRINDRPGQRPRYRCTMAGVAAEIAFHSLLAHRWLSGRTDCRHFSDLFGRGEVYQLAPAGTESEEEFSPQHLRGRFLFDQGINYTYLDDRFSSGATI